MTKRGPRPWAIRVFALLFALQALLVFGATLADLDGQLAYYTARYPGFAFDHDAMIILASARLTIAAIPVALVWFYASRFALWMATFFAALRLLRLPAAVTGLAAGHTLAPIWLASIGLGIAAISMLFTLDGRAWFKKKEAADAATFN